MSEGQQFLLLLRTHLRMARTKFRKMVTSSRLMSLTLLMFLVTYSVTAYLLFRRGLIYFGQLPAAGGLLVDRMIHIVFFCFLAMLMFSVGVSGYIALYRSRDTRWLLTLPISHRVLFLWKVFEAAAFSSWGLLLISAPLLVAFAEQRGAGLDFYLRALLGITPFLIIAGSLAGILLLVTVRWMKRRHLILTGVICVVLFGAWIARTVLHERKIAQHAGFSAALTFQQVLKHTDISANRFIPSAWLASSIVDWSRPQRIRSNWLMPSLLLSWSLMGGLTASWLASRWFYASWNHSLQNAALAALRRRTPTQEENTRAIERQFRGKSLTARIFGRPLAAVTRKDMLSFRREPAQWIQFLIVFGLLSIYAAGLRRLNEHIDQPRDLFLVACLNLAVCALALSTLTTRFVFPQFSLEGRRLWILARSPLRLSTIVLQKFFLSTLFTSLAVSGIVLLSGNTLNLRREDVFFFTGAMLLMSLGLNGMAVGFGVLFPNLEESNSAKIVSGFGGTLCLVASFVYIVTFLLLIAWSRFEIFKKNEYPENWINGPNALLGLGLALLLTLVLTGGPLIFAMKRLKRLEILGSL
jgi:ABC-2 type transport system permease protein